MNAVNAFHRLTFYITFYYFVEHQLRLYLLIYFSIRILYNNLESNVSAAESINVIKNIVRVFTCAFIYTARFTLEEKFPYSSRIFIEFGYFCFCVNRCKSDLRVTTAICPAPLSVTIESLQNRARDHT